MKITVVADHKSGSYKLIGFSLAENTEQISFNNIAYYCNGNDLLNISPNIGQYSCGWLVDVECECLPASSAVATHAAGAKCKCGFFNEYAEPNRPDGSYLCFNCRR